jgi:hypothetical protein
VTIAALISKAIGATRLRILVFGPSPLGASSDPFVDALRIKRLEIQAALQAQGHTADFPESIVDPSLPPPFDNAWLQEQLLMQDYDLIILLVGSPGANVELGAISSKPGLCQKSQLFLCVDHKGGLADAACRLATQFDARLQEFIYPDDLTKCHLVTAVDGIVRKLQAAKTLLG